MPSRRDFLLSSAMPLLMQARLYGQGTAPAAPTTRPNVAIIDRGRILLAAKQALERPVASDRNVEGADFLQFTLDLPALTAAAIVDSESSAQYVLKARALLSSWLASPATRLAPAPALSSYTLVASRAGLAEVAVALPFLHLPQEDLAAVSAWFRQALNWLASDRTALLARDARDHNASAWLLETAAYAALLGDDAVLEEQRHQFSKSILRAQIGADGLFHHELTTDNSLRNSLYNLDLLAGSTVLLSTRFESLWDYELQDGPGMRVAIARHAAFMAAPSTWPYPADASHFAELPGRRPALLFAGRAYADAEYVSLWRTLSPEFKDAALLRTFPIRQPLLWVTHAAFR